jgi:hypothetical protein
MRCEGYVKPGIFQFTPQVWKQCEKTATVMIKFKQGREKINELPACNDCWQRCIDSKDIKILSVEPIKDNKGIESDGEKAAAAHAWRYLSLLTKTGYSTNTTNRRR